ncbi:unnamed protein product, partial [Staurois parvus]
MALSGRLYGGGVMSGRLYGAPQSLAGPVCITSAPGQGRTDNSWGPREIGDHGAPVSLPKLKKAYEKGTRGILWSPLLTPGPRAVPEFPNGRSAPAPGLMSC